MKLRREGLVLAVLALLVVLPMILPTEPLISHTYQWAVRHPVEAAWIIAAIFFLGVVFLLPVSPVVMMAGLMFGPVKGLLLVWTTGILASTAAFWIGRTVGRPWVQSRLKNNSLFVAVDRSIQRNGLRIALLVRLALFLPYGSMNYSLGVTNLSFSHYLIGTNIGMVPSFFLVVYLGSTVRDMSALITGDLQLIDANIYVIIVGLTMTVVSVTLIVKSSLRALRQELEP